MYVDVFMIILKEIGRNICARPPQTVREPASICLIKYDLLITKESENFCNK